MSPSDIVGPSPVTSNGTETTEIEDDATEEVRRASTLDEGPERRRSGVSQGPCRPIKRSCILTFRGRPSYSPLLCLITFVRVAEKMLSQ